MSQVEVFLENAPLAPGGSWARGAAVWTDRFARREELLSALPDGAARLGEWGDRLRKLNGFFALVRTSDDTVIAAVDRLRSIPLFYASAGGRLLLSDSAEWVRSRLRLERFDAEAEDEFRRSGYVTGRRTLFEGIEQLQAGEVLAFDGQTQRLDLERYYVFKSSLASEPVAPETATKTLDEAVDRSVHRLIEYADGRQIVVPLSGGYDSRLVALKLRQLAYPNVLTFTYGLAGNAEARVSQNVAESLGLAWHIVHQSRDAWRQAYMSADLTRYQRFASNWASVPHHQDWLAVRTMAETDTIEADAVFAPGHTGDFIAGGHLAGVVSGTRGTFPKSRLAEAILRKHLSLAPWTNEDRQRWLARLAESLDAAAQLTAPELASAFEAWEWQERQAKFIVNSVRVYEHFGYDWWLPLWDAELMDLFTSLPMDLRLGKGLYDRYVTEMYERASGATTAIYGARPLSASPVSLLSRLPALKAIRGRLGGKSKGQRKVVDHLGALGRYDPALVERLLGEGYAPNGITVIQFLIDSAYSGQDAERLGMRTVPEHDAGRSE